MNFRLIFTLPNLFSFIRIFLVIPIYYYISRDDNFFALLYIIFAFITDGLDGYLARKFNQISDVGKFLDPLADKICTTGGFIALTLYQDFPVWLTVAIISRDVLIGTGSILLMGQKKILLPSNKPGKWTIFVITLLGAIYIFKYEFLITPVLIVVVIMIIISFYNYARIFMRNIKDEDLS